MPRPRMQAHPVVAEEDRAVHVVIPVCEPSHIVTTQAQHDIHCSIFDRPPHSSKAGHS